MATHNTEAVSVEVSNNDRANKALSYAILAVACVVMVSAAAHAGSDTTFQEADNFVSDFLAGTGGKTIGGIALVSAVINTVTRFNWMFFGSAVAIGLACGIGPNIMNTFFTGIF